MRKISAIIVLCLLISFVIFSVTKADITSNPKSPESKTVIIMFDDGWDDQFMTAVPILQSFGLKATFDVYPAAMDGGWDSFMTWSQVEWLAQNGHDLESHSYSHQNLNRVSLSVLNEELLGSKRAFLAHGIQTGELALPYGEGAENATVIQAAKDAGYLIVRSDEAVLDLTNTPRSTIQVNNMNNATTIPYLAYLLRDVPISILIYHHINDDTSDPDSVRPNNFTLQMNYLKTNGYNVATLSDLFFDITPLPPALTTSPSSSPPTPTMWTSPSSPATTVAPTGETTIPALTQEPLHLDISHIDFLGITIIVAFIAVCIAITFVLRLKNKPRQGRG